MAKKPKKKDREKQAKEPEEVRMTKSPYPLWARAIVTVTALFWLALSGLFAWGFGSTVVLVKQARQPEFIKQTLSRIAQFKSLPEGFESQFAVSIYPLELVQIRYLPDNSDFFLSCWYPLDKRKETSRQIVDKLAENFLPSSSSRSKLDGSDSIPVAGKTLEYVLGSADDPEGDRLGCMVGGIVLPDGRTFVSYGVVKRIVKDKTQISTDDKTPVFNIETAAKLFSAIEDFKAEASK